MKFTLEINCSGAAFSENPELELSALLHGIANTVHYVSGIDNDSHIKQSVVDVNGNVCGTWTLGSE